MRALLTAHQVAAALSLRSARSFHNRRAALEAEGFPRPVRGLPDRWDPAAIEAWLAAQRPAAAAPDSLAAAEQTLIARAQALA